ncbi:DUF2214 family protein [Chryseolinea soli]|uniref:DUF2214 family protein n=1 Tax=Chryseolinea soli TaxID=2321403 RepID=A0A385SUV1_9BACT|nr:DUF2214 family protein [Chryseolinea soli]AYB32578.1 DUF2214 family protein [Chryseolinea soli]
MRTQIFLRILLTLHITGIVIMAGTSFIDYFTFKLFWRFADHGDNRSLGLLPLMSRYGEFVRIGGVIIIATGLAMLLLVKGVWWEQSWFKIKMALVVMVVLNGVLFGNKLGTKFREVITNNSTDFIQQTAPLRTQLNRFYILQLTLFFVIVLVSVLKFSRSEE